MNTYLNTLNGKPAGSEKTFDSLNPPRARPSAACR